jgi:hypothetical protein
MRVEPPSIARQSAVAAFARMRVEPDFVLTVNLAHLQWMEISVAGRRSIPREKMR